MKRSSKITGWIAGVLATVASAWGMDVPEYLMTFHDGHNAEILVTQSNYNQDVRQTNLSDYRRDINQLERDMFRARTIEEKKLIELQLKNLKQERDDYKNPGGTP